MSVMPMAARGAHGIPKRVERILFLLACMLCTLPVFIPEYPPMVDLPQHAAQVAMYLNLRHGDFPFAQLFTTHLFTPYLVVYGLIASFTPLLGIVAACKLVVALGLFGFPLATRFFLREAGADDYWAWLVFPVLYGFCYQWGFITFIVSAPVGMVFLGYVWRRQSQPDPSSGLLLTAGLYLLFFFHALILAFFGGIALIYWWMSKVDYRGFARVAWPLLTPLPLAVVWLLGIQSNPLSQLPTEWDLSWTRTVDTYYADLASWHVAGTPGWGRVNGFFPRELGVRPGSVVTWLGLGLFALPLVAGSRVCRNSARWVPFGFVVAVTLWAPSMMFGVAFLFQRFTFLAFPLFLATLDRPNGDARRWQTAVAWAAPVAAVAWITLQAVDALRFEADESGFDTILAQMEPGKRALSLVLEPDDGRSIAPTFVHFPVWYSALKGGVSDPSFAETQIQPIAYRPESRPSFHRDGFSWFPRRFDWQVHGGGHYDYFVARSGVDAGAYLFRTATCNVFLDAHAGHWWLYRRDPYCASAGNAPGHIR